MVYAAIGASITPNRKHLVQLEEVEEMRIQFLAVLIGLGLSAAAQAGNVSAQISGGHLYLYGDAGGSNLTVDSTADGQVRVTGTVTADGEDTVVNGQPNGSVELSGWTRGIYNYSYAGNDTLSLVGLTIQGPAHIDLGEGDDGFIVGELVTIPVGVEGNAAPAAGAPSSAKSFFVLGLGGSDTVILNDLFVEGAATLDLGNGEDLVFIGSPAQDPANVSVVFSQSCVIVPGNQADSISISSTDVYRNLIVDDAQGELLLDISDVNVDDSVFIYGTPANDQINTQNLNVTRLLKVISEGGDDDIVLAGTSDTTEVFPGLGNDSVLLVDLATTRASVYLDPGNDEVDVQGGSYSFLYGYGGGGNDLFRLQNTSISQAFLYGDGGSDSYVNGGGNMIGKLNLFSIENK